MRKMEQEGNKTQASMRETDEQGMPDTLTSALNGIDIVKALDWQRT